MTAPPAPPAYHFEALTVTELARLHDADARLQHIAELIAEWRAAMWKLTPTPAAVTSATMAEIELVVTRR